MYFTDRGIEELEARRGDEEVTLAWVADRLQEFVDTFPEFETPVERLATWLARLHDPDEGPEKSGGSSPCRHRVAEPVETTQAGRRARVATGWSSLSRPR